MADAEWYVNADQESVSVIVPYVGDVQVADCFNTQWTAAEMRANAHLIASAPRLLEVLREWRDIYPHCLVNPDDQPITEHLAQIGPCGVCIQCRTEAAIAAARGAQ